MAGTLFGLGLSQQFDVNGDPMSGCLLYVYEANTSTPVTTYRNFALTAGQEHAWPLEADSTGRIPAFWVDDGSYRARLTDAGGNPQFDEANMTAIGASAGTGGGGDTTDPDSVSSTGDVKWRPINTTLAGWVRINGRTIGSATSGASERANADVQTLYEYIWNNFTDTLCPVVTGRGANAAADFAANKQITLLDMRGRSPFGLDDMGNTAAAMFSGVTFDTGDEATGGSDGGDAVHTLTLAQLPAHDHGGGGTTSSDGTHTHFVFDTVNTASPLIAGEPASVSNTAGGDNSYSITGTTGTADIGVSSSDGAHTHTLTVTSQGSGSAHPTISPFVLGSWYMRL